LEYCLRYTYFLRNQTGSIGQLVSSTYGKIVDAETGKSLGKSFNDQSFQNVVHFECILIIHTTYVQVLVSKGSW
jgi:hypothetical protein